MESIQQGGKNKPYNGKFNNYNKTYLPAKTTTLSYANTVSNIYLFKTHDECDISVILSYRISENVAFF